MTTALLLMDFQHGIAARLGDAAPAPISAARRALEAARAHGIRVVFVRVAFRSGFPEVSSRNKTFSASIGSPTAPHLLEDAPATQIIGDLAPHADEPVVIKRRVGAFASDLDLVLRGLGVTRLVLGGISTSGVVLSTVREAADRDFGLTVLADAVADAGPEVHRVLLDKVLPRQADVITVDEWVAAMS